MSHLIARIFMAEAESHPYFWGLRLVDIRGVISKGGAEPTIVR